MKLLNWMYTNPWNKLEVGKCRYGLMLDENGMVFDDGVTVRLADQHFMMTTTTGGAARVLTWLERWLQTEWPDMKVRLSSVTDHWATFAVVGPKSRKVVQKVCWDIDFGNEAFPFMSYRNGTVAGAKARVMRISFSGELAYEVNVPANAGRSVWEALMAAGAEFDITPYGTETMHVLRAEKGYIIVGQDTDGSITPYDLGMGGVVAKSKRLLGKRSLARSDTAKEGRKQFVGLLTEDEQFVLPEGAQIIAKDTQVSAVDPTPMIGHVTSSYYSPILKRSIALAVVKGGLNKMGESVVIPLANGKRITAKISARFSTIPKGCASMWNETRNQTQVAGAGGATLESPFVGAADVLKPHKARASKKFTLRERPFLDLVNVRGELSDPAFVSAFERVVGCRPPAQPNTVARGAEYDVLWLGPDEWLVRSNGPVQAGVLEAQLAEAVQGSYAAAVDVGSGYTVVEISGERVRDVLARGCPLDLHPRMFAGPVRAVALLQVVDRADPDR